MYCLTNTNKLICLNINTLQYLQSYSYQNISESTNINKHHNQTNNYNNNNNNNNSNNNNNNNKLSNNKFSMRPVKILFVRNSLILLNCNILLEFNLNSHTLINTLILPFDTLDITIQ
mgnify:CR=1 FL=1